MKEKEKTFLETTQNLMELRGFWSETTKTKVTILSKEGEKFNKKTKIKKYRNLGYNVYDMNNKEIK